jgi:hypothetical protein
LKYIPYSRPAMPAMNPPMANVITMIRLMSTPRSDAVSGSSATARMPWPVRVVLTNRSRAISMRMPTTTIRTCWLDTCTPKIVRAVCRGMNCG